LFFNRDSTGFSEMLASELMAVSNTCGVELRVENEYPKHKCDYYVYPVQYREDVLSSWLSYSIERCKRQNSLVFVCGKSSAVEYRYILEHTSADFVLLGECDITFKEILTICQNAEVNKCIEQIKHVCGVSYREGDRIVKSKKRTITGNMDELPLPRYEYLADRQNYRICVMESSRCCHGKCNFCEGHLFRSFCAGIENRGKSPERIVEEIQYVVDTYGCRVFSFADDNFMMDSEKGLTRAINLAELLLLKKLRIRFTIECRADDIQLEVFQLLKRAGLIKVFVGLESGAQSVLDRYHKGTTVDDNHHAVKTLNRLHIMCHPGHILFDPKTTPQELKETVAFFEQYLDSLFSFDSGDGDRLLYYPCGCSIVDAFWPDRSEQFYRQVWYSGIPCPFENETTKKIYEVFRENMNQSEKYSSDNILKRRILCLKSAIESVTP